jgi:hypothetical protein
MTSTGSTSKRGGRKKAWRAERFKKRETWTNFEEREREGEKGG